MIQAAVLFGFSMLLSGVTAYVFFGHLARRGELEGLDPNSLIARFLRAGQRPASAQLLTANPVSAATLPIGLGSGAYRFVLADQPDLSVDEFMQLAAEGCGAIAEIAEEEQRMVLMGLPDYFRTQGRSSVVYWQTKASLRTPSRAADADMTSLARLVVDGFADINRRLDRIEHTEQGVLEFRDAFPELPSPAAPKPN